MEFMFSVVRFPSLSHFSLLLSLRRLLIERVCVGLGNHTNTERPWLSSFAPRLQEEMNRLAGEEREGEKVVYEVVASKEDKEPLEVV